MPNEELKKLADTPRTDALVQITEGAIEIFDRLPMLNHARTLERECAALQKEVESLKYYYNLAMSDWETSLQDVVQVREDALEEAAKVCEQADENSEGPDCWDWHSKDYAKAIRALKQHTGEDGETKP